MGYRYGTVFLCAVGCLSLAGCGSGDSFSADLAEVTGTITIDGKPGADLLVNFAPEAENAQAAAATGMGSDATTDASGKYELKYKGSGKKGALVGKHKVTIERGFAGGGPAGGASGAPEAPLLPPKDLSAQVKKGDKNVINFDITSE